jgi:LacI family transcriptional regulator
MKPKTPTMEAVALKAGVSITTVSHVINKTRHVNQETKDVVMMAIKELNYQSVKMTKSNGANSICIGVILADAREDYYIAMIKAIDSTAADYGVSVIFCDSEASFENEERNLNVLLTKQVNGVLLAPVDADRMPVVLQKNTIPIVLIDRQYEFHNFLSVGINNSRSSYLGTKYILGKGCKKVGFIGYSDPIYTTRQRVQGYLTAVMEFDRSLIPKILYIKYNGSDSFPLIEKFILDNEVDGLICANSTLCYEFIEVLDTLDTEIQERIKIVTFDENRWFDYIRYPVTVISQPVAEIGNAALENLLQMIEQINTPCNVKRDLFFDVSIIDRIK